MATSGVEGSFTDGVMTCKYTIDNSELPSGNLKMGYGMGELIVRFLASRHEMLPIFFPIFSNIHMFLSNSLFDTDKDLSDAILN